MIPNNCNYKKVHIQITTYTKQQTANNMNHEKEVAKSSIRPDNSAKFICSICLNAKPKSDEVVKLECNKRRWRSCPICHKDFDLRRETSTDSTLIRDKCEVGENPVIISTKQLALSTKTVQTSETDVSQGLNLLNEVLTVFQSKKHLCNTDREKHTKTVIVKDASVETEKLQCKKNIHSTLTLSKVFFVSIEENEVSANNKFTIINCSEPRRYVSSQYSIDLIKHKSSSIPQMKLEELKHSLKEKTKSKDAIEEVNRMFATVRKNNLQERINEANRPLIRNGPRVLPVVKTENNTYVNEVSSKCRFCHNNYLLSSGDSFAKAMCCQKVNDKTENFNKVRCYKCCLHSRDLCEQYCLNHFDDGCHYRRDDGQNEGRCPK